MIDLYRMDSEGPGRETGKGASSSWETSVVNSAGAEATFAKYTAQVAFQSRTINNAVFLRR